MTWATATADRRAGVSNRRSSAREAGSQARCAGNGGPLRASVVYCVGSCGCIHGRLVDVLLPQLEGTVNKIKMIKRQMFGRAKPDLLRKRVLLAQ